MPNQHPNDVLFSEDKPLPVLPAVEHYAGAEKLIRKAYALQHSLGPVFDITADCEDGAPTGTESEHAHMVATLIMSEDNRYGRVGTRIHDITHPHWQEDLRILIAHAGQRLAYITLPKPRGVDDVRQQLAMIRHLESHNHLNRCIPVHVLIETHGALRDVWDIAALPGIETLDFGLMDFVSAHHGAIPSTAMTSPGQFEHPLVARAKCMISTAALSHGLIPSHNVTTELKDPSAPHHDAYRARHEFGFLRMWSIHPNQILPIIEAMRPDFSEVETATLILIAAQDAHWGPIQHAGKLHDRASYRYYWELLLRAKAMGMPLPDMTLVFSRN